MSGNEGHGEEHDADDVDNGHPCEKHFKSRSHPAPVTPSSRSDAHSASVFQSLGKQHVRQSAISIRLLMTR